MPHTMTDHQATDEGVLLLVRKLMRLHPAAAADLMGRIPEGARLALAAAERRADVLRDQHGIDQLTYPMDEFDDEGDE
jgi:hypothetical protein